jgi:hypothetical protein
MQYQLKKNITGNGLQPVMKVSRYKQRCLVRVFAGLVAVALLLGLVSNAHAVVRVSDSFTVSSDTPLPSHIPDMGTGWTEVFDDTSAGTDLKINAAADHLRSGYADIETGNGQAYTAQPNPTSPDQDVSITIATDYNANYARLWGIFARRTDDSNFYHVQIVPDNYTSQDTFTLFKYVGGVATKLGGYEATITAGDVIKLEIRDAAKKVYINGTERISSSDNSLTAAGTWGIYWGNYNGAGDGGDHYRIWEADDFLAEEPSSWYGNSCWQYRKKLTLDSNLVEADLTDFPVLISLTGDSDLPAAAQSDFDDVLFTSADGTTKLSHEIEAYDSANGDIVAWVKIPSLSSSSDTDIYMYYGCGTACNQQNAADVWSNNYVGVWHLKEATGTQTNDSTSYANHGTPSSSDTPTQDTGQIDGALYFNDDGAPERNVSVTDNNTGLDLPSAMTVSGWVRTSDNVNDPGLIVNKWSNTASEQNYWLGKLSDTNIAFYVDGGSSNVTASLGLIDDGADFHHVVGVADPTGGPQKLRIYVDGIQRDSTGWDGSSYTADTALRIGNSPAAAQEFKGTIDEVRVQSTNRSAAWILTEYDNIKNPGVGTGKFIKSLSNQEVGGSSWYNPNWQYRKRLTLDSSMVAGDLAYFPVLVSLTSDSDLANDAQNDFDDILFTLSDGNTKLAHEIEDFDPDSGKLIAWVKVPSLNACVDTYLYMYYGYDTIGNQENAAGVWDDNFKGVWHLKEDPSGTAPQATDSTQFNNHGTSYGSMTDTDQVPGRIDGSWDFDGLGDPDGDYIDQGTDASLDMGAGDFTLETWFKTSTQFQDMYLAGNGMAGAGGKRYMLMIRAGSPCGNGGVRTVIDDDDTGGADICSSAGYNDGFWHHVATTRDGNNLRLYMDGSEVSASPVDITGVQGLDDPRPFTSGILYNDGVPNYSANMVGQLDEIRISSTARSAGWIDTEHDNITNQGVGSGKFIKALGSEDDGECKFSYRRSLTIDGDKVGGSSGYLDDFSMLVHLTGAWLKTDPDGDIQNSDGYDIIFRALDSTTCDGTAPCTLDHEIEKYDGVNGELIAWVRVPKVYAVNGDPGNDTVIYMYYDNLCSTVDPQDAAGVWSYAGSPYKGVWHLKETTGGSQAIEDSTSNYNHGTDYNSPTFGAVGQIDGSLEFDDTNERHVLVDDDASLQLSLNMTVSVWMKNTSTGTDVGLMVSKWADAPDRNYWFGRLNQFGMAFFVDDGQAVTVPLGNGQRELFDGSFHYLVGVADSSNNVLRFYVNGVEEKSQPYTGSSRTGTATLRIGQGFQGGQEFEGTVDEVRVQATDRSAEWIETEFNNQDNPGNVGSAGFYSVGDPAEAGPPTAISLTSFTAIGAGNAVQVDWQTASEFNNIGFHLYRATSPGGPYSRLTDKLISARPRQGTGAGYSYVDSDVTVGNLYYYKLEDIDVFGKHTMHGPISVDWDADGMPDDWEITHRRIRARRRSV